MSQTTPTDVKGTNSSREQAAANARVTDAVLGALGLRDDDGDGDGDGPGATALSLDDALFLLRNERRRRAIRETAARETTTASDLAEHIASIEEDKPIAKLTGQERKRLYITLYQTHLPKLDANDALAFDSDRKTIEATAETHALAALLRDINARTGGGDER